MDKFGIKLKELRMGKKESQKDLAEKLNVSFQSISKWEQGIHYPDVFMLKELAEHYGVNVSYFFDEKKNKKNYQEYILKTKINTNDTIVTWTDFEHNGSIAPKSILDETRHRAGNGLLITHPGPKNYLIIAVNDENEICLMAEHRNNRFPICGPQGNFYSKSNETGANNPCLILKSTYQMGTYGTVIQDCERDFEFVIPKNGFLINVPYQSIESKEILMFITQKIIRRKIARNFPNCLLFYGELLPGELKNIKVKLINDTIVFEKYCEDEVQINENGDQETLNLLEALEERIDNLEKRISELESKIDDLEDLEDRIDILENSLEDLDD